MIRAVLTDIEGTTSSIAFVKETLFPYAREHLPAYIKSHINTPAVIEQLNAVRGIMNQADLTVEQIITQLISWSDDDQKIAPLKILQGLVWETGYRQGDFYGHVYSDVANFLRAWQASGVQLYIYSSGSVYAQKLLFSHTEYGDLTTLFSGYFDTAVGKKNQADSYRNIVTQISLSPAELLFLSDVEAELDAAAAAGMKTMLLARSGGLSENTKHPLAADFAEVDQAFFKKGTEAARFSGERSKG